ncbi:UNVERIFIED_CONTAM: hypothetical protein Slati_0207700 [Sesamum latifolium]|uniref:RNase H type-1 domain-containing protein n=1 Tax=Sesamum latifolium TaxID=2727402 RepID=A0AAW2YBV9_9LAMI
MNTDGASKGNPGISSVGGILRDQLGKVIFVSRASRNITNTQAELHAIHRGLQICIDRGFRNVWIEIDATAIIKGLFLGGLGTISGQLRAIYLLFLAAHTPAYAHLGVDVVSTMGKLLFGTLLFVGTFGFWHYLYRGIEVDQAKIDVIKSLPYPASVRKIRSFLGHAGFYKRFIKVFSKIAQPLCKLLQKDEAFEFDEA